MFHKQKFSPPLMKEDKNFRLINFNYVPTNSHVPREEGSMICNYHFAAQF